MYRNYKFGAVLGICVIRVPWVRVFALWFWIGYSCRHSPVLGCPAQRRAAPGRRSDSPGRSSGRFSLATSTSTGPTAGLRWFMDFSTGVWRQVSSVCFHRALWSAEFLVDLDSLTTRGGNGSLLSLSVGHHFLDLPGGRPGPWIGLYFAAGHGVQLLPTNLLKFGSQLSNQGLSCSLPIRTQNNLQQIKCNLNSKTPKSVLK